jgi:thiol-disulfide isomerase/thioredoxin
VRAAVLLLALGCATTGPARPPSQEVGQPLPPLVMEKMEGGRLHLDDFRGKVVLLDLWASWCPPCKEEMPVLNELAARLADTGVVIIALSVDEERPAAEAFLTTQPKWNMILAHDPQGLVPGQLQPPKMPTSYIIDATGIVRHVNAGYEPADGPRIEALLRELAGRR